MCIYMYILLCVYMCMCIHVYTCIHIHMYTHNTIYIYIHIHKWCATHQVHYAMVCCTCNGVYTYIHTILYTHIYTCIHIYTHNTIYIYIRIHKGCATHQVHYAMVCCTCNGVHTYIHTILHTYIYTCIHIYTHNNIYIYIYTYIKDVLHIKCTMQWCAARVMVRVSPYADMHIHAAHHMHSCTYIQHIISSYAHRCSRPFTSNGHLCAHTYSTR